MGLSWQQGPLAPGAIGRFLVPDPLPGRLLFAEPLRRRMRARFGGVWVAEPRPDGFAVSPAIGPSRPSTCRSHQGRPAPGPWPGAP
jgi:hypothetical protein